MIQRGLLILLLVITSASFAGDIDSYDETVRVFIFLEDLSLSEAVNRYSRQHNRAPSRQWQQQHSTNIKFAQKQLRTKISPYVEKEHSALSTALNGFRATIKRRLIPSLRNIDGVRDVVPIIFHDIDNFYSVPWIGSPHLWQSIGDGQDITIAVIDTGVDYLHANFGGIGDADDYASNDFNLIEPDSFPTAKVIGGWDFAGPTYNSREDDDPQPDPDPLDGHGHGSHVSGTALGVGVPGIIGPGVAKGAKLLALKVFSDIGGSTDLTIDAIDRALDPNGDGSMDDHVDVINMSLGARFGLVNDPSAIAAGNAMNAGVVVVASAGNNGDIPYVIGSPGVNPDIITVAASVSGDRRQIALASNVSNGQPLLPALQGSGPVRISIRPQFGPIVLAQSKSTMAEPTLTAWRSTDLSLESPGSSDSNLLSNSSLLNSRACSPLTNSAQIEGQYVLVARGACNFPIKYRNVQAAGGRGIVVFNTSNSVEDLFVMGGLDDSITIPGLMITANDGQQIIDELALGTTVRVGFGSLFTLPVPPSQDDTLASFTSRGPGPNGSGFKPSITAPGRFIFSTAAGTGNQGLELRGTSMAAPHVAGMAALLKQQFPDYSTQAIKSLLMNSASPSNRNGPGSDSAEILSRQGMGVLRGNLASQLKAFTEPAGVSFDYVNVKQNQQLKRIVSILNRTNEDLHYQVSHKSAASLAGVSVDCPETVHVTKNSQASFTITLNIDAALIPPDDATFSINEVSGWCVLNDGNQTLRTGYMATVDSVSNIVPVLQHNEITASDSDAPITAHPKSPAQEPVHTSVSVAPASTYELKNTGPATGLARSFLLVAQAAPKPSMASSITSVGWRHSELFTFPLFELAISMAQPWDNPSNLRWFLFVDTDFDQTYERVLFGVDWSFVGFDPGQILTGIDYLTDIDDVGTDASIYHWMVEKGDYNDQVIVLPFFNASSGINALFKPNETAFNFRLIAVDRYDNFSEIFGHIDLTNPLASQQHELEIEPGGSIEIMRQDHDQLWLVPTNTQNEQHFVVPRDL